MSIFVAEDSTIAKEDMDIFLLSISAFIISMASCLIFFKNSSAITFFSQPIPEVSSFHFRYRHKKGVGTFCFILVTGSCIVSGMDKAIAPHQEVYSSPDR